MSGQDRGGKKTVMHKVHVLKFAGADLPPRTIVARVSDESIDRQRDIVVAAGCDFSGFARNPVVLWQHDPERPIGRAAVTPGAGFIDAAITFAPEGVSIDADTAYALIKHDVLRGISIGFRPIDYEALPGGGTKYTRWELLEISIVSVPANPNALVARKSARRDASSLAVQIAARLNKCEAEHVNAEDAHDACLEGDSDPETTMSEMRKAVKAARAHIDAARALAKRLANPDDSPSDEGADNDDEGADPDDADIELAAVAASRKRSAAILDLADVGAVARTAVSAPETRGGAHLTADVREKELAHLRRFWN